MTDLNVMFILSADVAQDLLLRMKELDVTPVLSASSCVFDWCVRSSLSDQIAFAANLFGFVAVVPEDDSKRRAVNITSGVLPGLFDH